MLNLKTILLVCCSVVGISGCAIPPVVAFTALKTASTTSDGVIKFENVILNEGNAYEETTGEFTAPTDGVYVFSWTVTTRQGEATITELYVNGVRRGRAAADARGGTSSNSMDDTASNTIAVRMWRNQIATIKVHSSWDNYVDGNDWSSFSGRRIFM